MKLTFRNGKGNATHNDRSYENQSNKSNEYICYDSQGNEINNSNFKDAEMEIYKELFTDGLDAQNERYKKARQHKNKKTLSEFYTAKEPVESIIQLGNIDDSYDSQVLGVVVADYVEYLNSFEGVVIMNTALHCDESTPHVHLRHTFTSVDRYGHLEINKNKCLKNLGIALPKPNEKESRYNNRVMTFDKMCREKLFEICEGYDITLDKAVTPNMKHKSIKDYKYEQSQKLVTVDKTLTERNKQLTQLNTHVNNQNALNSRLNAENEQLKERNEQMETNYSVKLKENEQRLQATMDELIQEESRGLELSLSELRKQHQEEIKRMQVNHERDLTAERMKTTANNFTRQEVKLPSVNFGS